MEILRGKSGLDIVPVFNVKMDQLIFNQGCLPENLKIISLVPLTIYR